MLTTTNCSPCFLVCLAISLVLTTMLHVGIGITATELQEAQKHLVLSQVSALRRLTTMYGRMENKEKATLGKCIPAGMT